MAWLGPAAEHRSHLYESHQADRITPHLLGLLDPYGGPFQAASEQSSEHARQHGAADRALGQWAVQSRLVRVGAGEAGYVVEIAALVVSLPAFAVSGLVSLRQQLRQRRSARRLGHHRSASWPPVQGCTPSVPPCR